ncbi:hypothetical protein C6A36_00650 [Desulfobacteraceae bacterium SEEP-SAG10]|nr:hypothetical protein C6A36_00650 [Desulfobacteraceae bacterium SEEP-SAG10]
MKKHASSHGLAVLVCTITSGILVKMGYDYFPHAAEIINNISQHILDFVGIEYPPKAISTLLLAVILAMIWGIAFSFMHSDKKPEK